MASSSQGFSYHNFDLINGKWIILASVTSDAEFKLTWTAYEGRDKICFWKGERGSSNSIHLDIFLLVTRQIKSTNPFKTLEQAIRFYGLCNLVREQDFDLLKRISDFVVEYHLLSEEHRDLLRTEISLRIPAKRAADIARLVKKRKESEEALALRLAEERKEEDFWASPEVAAEVARAERAHLKSRPALPLQELVVLTGPQPGQPPIEPLESGHSPSRIRISSEELALIVAFRQAIVKKERINWQAYQGLKEFDRLGLEAILDPADLVENETLPCAQIVPASELSAVVYARLGAPPLSPKTLRSTWDLLSQVLI